ncbi:hypothetical protein JST97_16385 [bacterium]|nr:hypothetical protein [bacterium]
MSDLEGLLGLLEAEGRFHSRGEFTLDPGRNREKIAQLLREDANSWLYWLVRCGVSLKSHSCEITTGRNALLAQLNLSSSQPVQGYLQDGLENGQVGLRYLRSALLWAQAWLGMHPDFGATLLLEEPGQPLWALRLEADRVTRQQEPQLGEKLQLSLAFMPRTQRSQTAFMLAQRQALAASVPVRAAFSPMPVWLDGQRLDRGFQESVTPLYLRYYLQPGRSNCLAVPPPPAAHLYRLEAAGIPRGWPRPRFCLPSVAVHTFSLAGELPAEVDWSLTAGRPVAAWHTDKEATQLYAQPLEVAQTTDRWLVRSAFQRGGADNDYWAVVQHGISLDPEPLELGAGSRLGWLAMVGLDAAQTDLSGLKLVKDPLFESLNDWVRLEIAQIHEQQTAAGF